MEKFETGTTTVAAEVELEEGVYSPEQIAAALAEAEAMIEEGTVHPTPEKVTKLKQLLNILGVTEKGSDRALYNEHRFIVDELASLSIVVEAQLKVVEAELKFKNVIARHPNVFPAIREAETA